MPSLSVLHGALPFLRASLGAACVCAGLLLAPVAGHAAPTGPADGEGEVTDRAAGEPAAATRPALLAFAARVIGDDQRTRVVIDFDGKPTFSVHYIANPPRVVIDLPSTGFGIAPDDLMPRGLISDIRYGTMSRAGARMVLTATGPVRLATADTEARDDGKGFRLILDAVTIGQAEFDDLLKAQDWTLPSATPETATVLPGAIGTAGGDFVVAVDAGHGGIDTGAVSESGTEEKAITLAFARALAGRLNREVGIRAILTREDDTFLSLQERVDKARAAGAQLFVSFHADKLKQDDIRGATVYTISDTASDKLAQSVAERENFSDELAGIRLSPETSEVADILLDLTRRETQAFSENFARSVVSSFDGQVELINNPHRYAGFRVLRAPDVPSILLELGFLSNRQDEKLLLREDWRGRIADLLTDAVRRYRTTLSANGG